MKKSASGQFPVLLKSHSQLPSRPLQRVPSLGEAAWRCGSYWSNSGLSNSTLKPPRSNSHLSASLPMPAPHSIYDDLKPARLEKSFYSNIATTEEAEVTHTNLSMMNVHSTSYDPVTHVVRRQPGPRQTKSLKGVGYAYHKHMRSAGGNQGFIQAFERNPKAFYRRSGEFSRFEELVVKSRAR